MKKITLLTLITISSLSAGAQAPVSSLNENFDVSCATSSFPYSDNWSVINPVSGTNPLGAWNCTPTDGRKNPSGISTPGMQCTGTWSVIYHLDTSYFISPLLILPVSVYPGHVYLQFDSKTTNIHLGGRLSLLAKADTPYTSSVPSTDISAALTPVFGSNDSTDWVTHQVDLTSYKDSGSFYFAFRYTSTNTSGSIWYLDNIRLTATSLVVSDAHVSKNTLPITILGNSTASQIALSYTTGKAGVYHIAIYDMVGRRVYDGQVIAQAGTESYVIKGLDLHPGMYCIKMGNENTYGTAKLMIQ